MLQPLITVVIPAYNRERYVASAVESVLNQTYQNLEIIVVDDGSTDGTVKALEPYAGRIILFCQPNAGVSAARNVGIRAARGHWIAFLDSDDWWKPQKLERQVRAIEKYGVRMCFTRSESDAGEIFQDVEEVVATVKEPGVLHVADAATSVCLARRHPYVQSLLIEKPLLEKVGLFDESLSNADDTQIIFRLSFYSGYLYLDEPLVVIRIGTNNSLTYNQKPDAAIRRFNAYLRVQAEMYWRLVLDDPPKAAVSRGRMAYFTLRRAQLACATGDYPLTRALARNTMVMAVDLRTFLTGVLMYVLPWPLRSRCRKKFGL
jgi:glycosyltransferase involved in cell wall biosynthesis